MDDRTQTLAAEIFEERPELVRLAEDTGAYAELVARLKPLRFAAPAESPVPGASAPVVEIDGRGPLFVVEGDLLLDADELRFYALRREAGSQPRVEDPAPSVVLEPTASLTGISVRNVPARWDDPTSLAFCVYEASFPDRASYELARDNLLAAAADWQHSCGVRFVHLPQHDKHPDPTVELTQLDPRLVFAVRYVDAQGAFIASAFFPTSPPPRRRVLIDPSYFAADLEFDRVGVLRHELGHVLGFRHEHIRSGAPPECPQESPGQTIDLTLYDPHSVMHYFCGGVGSRDLAITAVDREGAQKLYGPPLDG